MSELSFHIKLEPNGIRSAFINVSKESIDSISFGLKTVEFSKQFPANFDVQDSFLSLKINEPLNGWEEQKKQYKNWLIRKGFEDLVKAIDVSLTEAYKFVSIFNMPNKIESLSEFNSFIKEIEEKASKKYFANKLVEVEELLVKKLQYKKQIFAINDVRNCLTHRGGIVQDVDIKNKDTNSFKVEWVGVRLFYKEDGKEIEINEPGHMVSGGTTITPDIQPQSVIFKINERITFDYKQFNQLVYTCYLFIEDLIASLPQKN